MFTDFQRYTMHNVLLMAVIARILERRVLPTAAARAALKAGMVQVTLAVIMDVLSITHQMWLFAKTLQLGHILTMKFRLGNAKAAQRLMQVSSVFLFAKQPATQDDPALVLL